MKAAVLVARELFELQELERPVPGEYEALLRVEACALCGSDLRIFHGEKTIDVPITGHEIAGVVEEVGSAVDSSLLGKRCVVETVVGCGNCVKCRTGFENLCLNEFKAVGYQFNGGFAQYLVVPAQVLRQNGLVEIPSGVSFEEATLTEPLSCIINGFRCIDVDSSKSVAVIGAGVIGVLAGLFAKSKKARVFLVNRSAPRLELVKQLGFEFDAFVDASKENPVKAVRRLSNGVGADIVFCACSAKEPQQQALEMAATNADISYFSGISKSNPFNTINTNLIHYNELHVHGANSSNAVQFMQAIEMLSSKCIDASRLITHTLPLEDIMHAIEVLEERSNNALKVVLCPWA